MPFDALTRPLLLDARLTEYLAAKGIGAVRKGVPLKGALSLKDGGETQPFLVLSERGLFLAGVAGAGVGQVEDALRAGLRYEEAVFGDTLVVGARAFGVPPGRGEDVRQLIGLARASPPSTPDYGGLWEARHIGELGALEARFFAGFLEKGEALLAWLETAATVEVPSPVAARRAPVRFCLTDRRAALIALSPFGDAVVTPLLGNALEVQRAIGRDAVCVGDVRFTVPLLLEGLYQELAPVLVRSPDARALEVARLNLLFAGKRKAPKEAARALLLRGVARRDPAAIVIAAALGEALALGEEARAGPVALTAALEKAAKGGLGRLWRAFRLPIEVGLSWLEALLTAGDVARKDAVELHAVLRDARLEATPDRFAQAAIDLVYAEHLLEAGREQEAQGVLEARLGALPSEELLDLLPRKDEDLTAGGGGQRFRVQILEHLVEARGIPGEQDAGTLAALARLEPLVPARLEAVVHLGEGHAKEAARQVLSVFERGGLAPLARDVDDAPHAEVAPLSKAALFERLQHPAAREGHPLGKLQGFLGSVRAPDHSALVDYCERLERDSAAQRALADASFVLGVPSVGGFVSRGDKAIGVRAYEGTTPFLLVGGRHLDPEGDFSMHPWELRFAIAAEVAHLRFRHTRATQSEVWAGAFEKGRFGFEVLFGLLPALKGVEVIDKVWEIIEGYKKGPIGRVVHGVDVAERAVTKARGKRTRQPAPPREQLVAAPNEKLVAAHRVMQLTADRAGLLLSSDLGAAVRSMFLSSHTYRPELPVAERHGLLATLSRRDDDEEMVFQDLAVRVAALVAFYLSDDYSRLVAALVPA